MKKGIIVVITAYVFLLFMGCGSGSNNKPCLLLMEYMSKGRAIISAAKGADRDRRLADLKLEYEPKIEKLPPEYATRIIQCNSFLRNLANAEDMEPGALTAPMIDTARKLAQEDYQKAIEGCIKGK